jgi:hypothetical protein
VDGRRTLDFPFVTQTTTWRSADGAAALRYIARRGTSEDTLGIFMLTVPAAVVAAGKPAELELTASAQGSKRWVSVVPYTDVVAAERGDR